MAKQCHITLVDFGFARGELNNSSSQSKYDLSYILFWTHIVALSPTDINTDIGLKKVNQDNEMAPKREQAAPTIVKVNKFDNASFINQALNDPSRNKGTESRGRGRTREQDMDNSISHAEVRDLSEFCYL